MWLTGSTSLREIYYLYRVFSQGRSDCSSRVSGSLVFQSFFLDSREILQNLKDCVCFIH